MEENKSKKSFVGGEGDNMHKKTVIFGFGQYGKKYIKKCVECKVENIQIIDSDDRLWGNVFMGIPIEEPQKVLPGFAGLVVIAVSDKFRWEIFEQLKNRYHISDGISGIIRKLSFYRKMKYIIWAICSFRQNCLQEVFIRKRNCWKYCQRINGIV